MPETIADVLADLDRILAEAGATFSLARYGLIAAGDFVAKSPRLPTNPDPTIRFGTGDPNTMDSRVFAQLKSSEMPAFVADGGPAKALLGRQWAVYVYAEWECLIRPRLAKARGVQPNDVKVSVFGDLRRIRHDILHHRSVATKEQAGQCEVLHWFQVGELIVIEPTHVANFGALVPWGPLEEGAE